MDLYLVELTVADWPAAPGVVPRPPRPVGRVDRRGEPLRPPRGRSRPCNDQGRDAGPGYNEVRLPRQRPGCRTRPPRGEWHHPGRAVEGESGRLPVGSGFAIPTGTRSRSSRGRRAKRKHVRRLICSASSSSFSPRSPSRPSRKSGPSGSPTRPPSPASRPGSRPQVWLPVPPTTDDQKVLDVATYFPAPFEKFTETRFGNEMYYLDPAGRRRTVPSRIRVVYTVERREVKGETDKGSEGRLEVPAARPAGPGRRQAPEADRRQETAGRPDGQGPRVLRPGQRADEVQQGRDRVGPRRRELGVRQPVRQLHRLPQPVHRPGPVAEDPGQVRDRLRHPGEARQGRRSPATTAGPSSSPTARAGCRWTSPRRTRTRR